MKKILWSSLSIILFVPIPVFAFVYTPWNLINSPSGWSILSSGNELVVNPVSGSGNNKIDIEGMVTNNSKTSNELSVEFNNLESIHLSQGNLRINIFTSDNKNLLKMDGNNQFGVSNQPNDLVVNSLITPINFSPNQSSEIHIQIKFTGNATYTSSSPFTLTFSP